MNRIAPFAPQRSASSRQPRSLLVAGCATTTSSAVARPDAESFRQRRAPTQGGTDSARAGHVARPHARARRPLAARLRAARPRTPSSCRTSGADTAIRSSPRDDSAASPRCSTRIAPKLLERIDVNPSLATGPQFIPFYFASWEQLRQAVDLFVRANGNPRAATDQTMQQYFAILSASFQSAADREWLRLFVDGGGGREPAVLSRLLAERVARACRGRRPGGLTVAADVAAVAPALPQQHAAAERRAVSLASARRRGSHGALRQGAERRRGRHAGFAARARRSVLYTFAHEIAGTRGEHRDRGQHHAGRASRRHDVAVRAVGGGARRRAAAREDDAERGAGLHALLPPVGRPRRADRSQGGVHVDVRRCPTRSTTRSRGSST